MLLLARRPGESIQIGPEIEVKIVHASASRVMVAVSAPRALKIWRLDAGHDSGQFSPPESEPRPEGRAVK